VLRSDVKDMLTLSDRLKPVLQRLNARAVGLPLNDHSISHVRNLLSARSGGVRFA
jgi:hypothetical protein